MKYWIYQDNQVKGPFDRAQIGQLKGFEADTLVCPEGRKGTDMGDWQRASSLPELSLLLSGGQIATATRPADADAAAELRKRLDELESQFERLQRELRAAGEGKSPASGGEELLSRLEAVEAKLSATASVAADVSQLRERLDLAESQPKAPAPFAAAAPIVAEIPVVDLAPTKPPAFAPADFKVETFEKVQLTAPPPAPAPEPVQLPVTPFASAQEPLPSLTPSPVPGAAATPLSFGTPIPFSEPAPQADFSLPAPAPFAQFGAAETPFPALGRSEEPPGPGTGAVDLAADSGRKGGSAGKKIAMVLLVVIFALGLALVGSLYMESKKALKEGGPGAADEGRPEPSAAAAPAPSATPFKKSKNPAGALGGEIAPADFSQSSVDLVKAFMTPGGQASLGDQLDKAFPSNGGLSPWMVEPLGGDKYQVTFYVGTQPLYVFKVQPKSRLVEGVNQAAVALINGEAPKLRRPAPAAKKPRRAAGRKKAAAPRSDTMIVAPGAQGSSNATLDQLLKDGVAPSRKRRQ